MALSFLAGLPKTATAAYPIIRRGVREGLSTRAIEQRVRQAGLKISRARSIVPIRRAILQMEEQGRAVAKLTPAEQINTARLPAANADLRKQYMYRIAVKNRVGADLIDQGYVHYNTDDGNLTVGAINNNMRELMRRDPEQYLLDNMELFLEFGEQRASFGDFERTPGGEFLMQGGAGISNRELLGQGGSQAKTTKPTI